MPTYIRLGIRAIYRSKFGTVRKGAWRRRWMGERGRLPNAHPSPVDTPPGLDSKMVKAVLQNLTTRQGKKYDDPASVASIRRTCKFDQERVAGWNDYYGGLERLRTEQLRTNRGWGMVGQACPAVLIGTSFYLGRCSLHPVPQPQHGRDFGPHRQLPVVQPVLLPQAAAWGAGRGGARRPDRRRQPSGQPHARVRHRRRRHPVQIPQEP